MWSSVAASRSVDPATDVLMAVLTPVLAVAVVWLLLSVGLTLLAAATESARRPTLTRFLRSLALPPVRRLVERTVAASMAVSLATSVAPSPQAVAAVTAVDAFDADDADDAGRSPAPTEEPVVRHSESLTDHATSDQPSTSPTPRSTSPAHSDAEASPDEDVDTDLHVVAAGENLWSVAAQVLLQRASVVGRSYAVGDAEIAPYWSRLIDANRTSLRSGDPDLVFPGERLTLPPV